MVRILILRIDIKQNPLYESAQVAYLDTHYYGGIKMPVACHAACYPWCVIKMDWLGGYTIGEDDTEPL